MSFTNCPEYSVPSFHILAKGLLEYETLNGEEIKDLLNGISPSKDDYDNQNDLKKSEPTHSVPKAGSKISPQPQ